MATSVILANDAGAPVVDLEANEIDVILSIRVDQIDVVERLRPVDPVWAVALGQIMLREGHRDPIEVCRLPGTKRWRLVTGAHRVMGARSAGIEHLRAIEVSHDRIDRRLREISENLFKSNLDPFARAAFIAELVALKKERAGIDPAKDARSVSASVRWQRAIKDEATDANATFANAYGFASEAADQLGLSRRAIEYDLALFRRVSPTIITQLRDAGHPIAKNATQLRALAKLPADEQAQVVDRLLLRGNSKDFVVQKVGDALTAMRGGNQAPDPEAKRLSAFLGAFERMGVAEKKGALAMLAALLPAGFSIAEGERAPAGEPADDRHRLELLSALDAAVPLLREVADIAHLGMTDFDILDRCTRVATELQLGRMSVSAGAIPISGGEA